MQYGNRKADAIGKISEQIVGVALQRCADSGKISGFRKINGQGADFLVSLPDQTEMELEVKSSFSGRRKHKRRYGKDTPVIIVHHWQKAMSMQERESHIYPAYLRIMNLVDCEMQKHRQAQSIQTATTA